MAYQQHMMMQRRAAGSASTSAPSVARASASRSRTVACAAKLSASDRVKLGGSDLDVSGEGRPQITS
jgi:hypothetical protein